MLSRRTLARFLAVAFAFTAILVPMQPVELFACGHDGTYVGVGYEQMFMYTPEHRLGGAAQPHIVFGPGFGANAVLGYDFCGSRWGMQIPFEFSRQRLDREEWVSQFNLSLEGVVHLAEWANGVDIRFVGGAGWSYLSEGIASNRTSAMGVIAHFGPGLGYYFSKTEKVTAALVAEVPVRMIHYFGDRLSANGTTVLAVPLRLSLQIGF